MSHNVWDVVGRLGIEPLIDVIVDPASLVKGKPDPEIFLAAAERLGVRFEDCVGIEDARAGIEAIRAARMVAVGVGADLPRPTGSSPTRASSPPTRWRPCSGMAARTMRAWRTPDIPLLDPRRLRCYGFGPRTAVRSCGDAWFRQGLAAREREPRCRQASLNRRQNEVTANKQPALALAA